MKLKTYINKLLSKLLTLRPLIVINFSKTLNKIFELDNKNNIV